MKKVGISVLVASAVMTTIASIIIIFSAFTSLNINYTAEDVSAVVGAIMTYEDGTTEDLGSLTFTPESTARTGSLSPDEDIQLTKDNKFVVIDYTFKNTGDKDFVAMYDYTDKNTVDSNIIFGYKGDASEFKETPNAILVKGGEVKTYSVKISVNNLARNAHLSGDISWDMTSNIVVATPETAQSILDQDINEKLVVFDEGEYSSLELRPTNSTAKAYSDNLLETELDKSTLVDDVVYYYYRELNNIEFVGLEGAKFNGVFSAYSGICKSEYGISSPNNLGFNDRSIWYDSVRNKDTSVGYYSLIQMDNISFKSLDFVGKNGRLFIDSWKLVENELFLTTSNNISVKNCSFNNTEELHFDNSRNAYYPAIHIESNKTTVNSQNVTIENNFIDGHYQGAYVSGTDNVTVKNNTILNTTHNGIAIQTYYAQNSDTNFSISGNFIITNNYISNTSDRAIRFGVLKDATIEISNNVFYNCTDKGSLLKTQISANECSYSFTNNLYDGLKLADETGTITNEKQWAVTV